MSDNSNPFGFGKLVPGFDFLQNLMEQAGKHSGRSGAPGLPGVSSWIAPTLNVDELDRRITELKAVSFWLDQNAKAVAATVQALEVQKMTLATLAGMNVAMGDVAKAFQVKTPAATEAAPAAAAGRKRRADASEAPHAGWPLSAEANASAKADGNPYQKSFQSNDAAKADAPVEQLAPSPVPESPAATSADTKAASASQPPATGTSIGGGVIDPMQWWGALTSQFQQIASNAMRDAGATHPALAATREMTGAAMKQAQRMAGTMAGSGSAPAKNRKAAASGAGPAAKKKSAGSASRKAPAKRASGRA